MNARTIDELGAMAAARRQLEMLTPDQRAEVLRDEPMVAELLKASRHLANWFSLEITLGHVGALRRELDKWGLPE